MSGPTDDLSQTERSSSLDLAPPKSWRRFVPLWLRSLIWMDSGLRYDALLSYSWKVWLRNRSDYFSDSIVPGTSWERRRFSV